MDSFSPIPRINDKNRTPRRRYTADPSFDDDEDIDKIGVWINSKIEPTKSPRSKFSDSYVCFEMVLPAQPSLNFSIRFVTESLLSSDRRGVNGTDETAFSLDDSFDTRSIFSSGLDTTTIPSEVVQVCERCESIFMLVLNKISFL